MTLKKIKHKEKEYELEEGEAILIETLQDINLTLNKLKEKI